MPELPVKNKDNWRDYMLRCCHSMNPDIDVGEGSWHWNFYTAIAEALGVQSRASQLVAAAASLWDMDEDQVTAKYENRVPRLTETPSSGYVVMEAAADGADIYPGDELLDKDTQQRFVVKLTAMTRFKTGELVQVESVDPGENTNVAGGKRLTWSTSRPGCYATAVVYGNQNGEGISGGSGVESLDEWKARISDAEAHPAVRGNEADIIQICEDATGRMLGTGEKTTGHKVPVEKAFVFPATMGAGTCGWTILTKQKNWWVSRKPKGQDMDKVSAYLINGMATSGVGADFKMLPVVPTDYYVRINVSLKLDSRATQWRDLEPWPRPAMRGNGCIVVKGNDSTKTATLFTLVSDNGVYTGVSAPSVGTSIGFFDVQNGCMVRKEIATVSGTGPWLVTTKTDGSSNTGYTPGDGQSASPWCDHLQDALNAIGKYVAKMGVGQCHGDLPIDGLRKLRVPAPETSRYDDEVTARVATDIVNSVPSVSGATFLQAHPAAKIPVIGVAQVALFKLQDVGIYKQ